VEGVPLLGSIVCPKVSRTSTIRGILPLSEAEAFLENELPSKSAWVSTLSEEFPLQEAFLASPPWWVPPAGTLLSQTTPNMTFPSSGLFLFPLPFSSLSSFSPPTHKQTRKTPPPQTKKPPKKPPTRPLSLALPPLESILPVLLCQMCRCLWDERRPVSQSAISPPPRSCSNPFRSRRRVFSKQACCPFPPLS